MAEPIANTTDWAVSILADRWIQRWSFTQNAKEQFLFEDHELFRKIREEFHRKLWSGRGKYLNFKICIYNEKMNCFVIRK